MTNAIVYSTQTGNTELLASTIRDTLPKDSCKYFGKPSSEALNADCIYVGFWTNKGTCDDESASFLKTLDNKNIFLFGTAGFGESSEYFDKVIKNTKKNIKSSNNIIGSFMCQGKMPMSVRKRYEKMMSNPVKLPNLQELIKNFDKALEHPNDNDLEILKSKISEMENLNL